MAKNDDKGLTLKQYYEWRRKDWYDLNVPWENVKAQHKLNIAAVDEAIRYHETKDRPLNILAVHGSGRHPKVSCALELSNSQLLLESGLDLALEELNPKPEVERLILREMFIEPCNNCVASCSAMCGFTCDCFPGDDMSTKAYPAVLRCDIMFMSTGVNQSMVSTRTKAFLDRLISVDGGYYRESESLEQKTSEFKQRMIKLSIDNPVYDQRMFGRVAAYFISSKDQNNVHPDPLGYSQLSYEDLVVGSLKSSNGDYGFFHADPYYVLAAAEADEDYSYDKAHYDKQKGYHNQSKEVVLAAVALAKRLKENPPEFKGGGRVNRT